MRSQWQAFIVAATDRVIRDDTEYAALSNEDTHERDEAGHELDRFPIAFRQLGMVAWPGLVYTIQSVAKLPWRLS